MRTVNELKQLPANELHDAINLDVIKECKRRQTELTADYLKKHPVHSEFLNEITESNKTFALHYTLGGLQALLRIAILDLQEAESKLESLEQANLKVLRISPEEWKEKMKEHGIR